MVLVFFFFLIMCCAVCVPVMLNCWFARPALNWPVISSIGRALHECTSIAEGVDSIPYKEAPDLLDGFSIGRHEKKSESFDIFAAKF